MALCPGVSTSSAQAFLGPGVSEAEVVSSLSHADRTAGYAQHLQAYESRLRRCVHYEV